MLCLARKNGESISLHTSDGIITIHINDIEPSRSRCKVTVDAPKDVKVLRSELEDKPLTHRNF